MSREVANRDPYGGARLLAEASSDAILLFFAAVDFCFVDAYWWQRPGILAAALAM